MYAEEEVRCSWVAVPGSQATNVSGETAKAIDEEVRRIIDAATAPPRVCWKRIVTSWT